MAIEPVQGMRVGDYSPATVRRHSLNQFLAQIALHSASLNSKKKKISIPEPENIAPI